MLYNIVKLFATPVYASTATPLENIISDSATVTTGVITNMGSVATFLTSNALMLIILGIAFAGLAGRWLARWIVSLRLG